MRTDQVVRLIGSVLRLSRLSGISRAGSAPRVRAISLLSITGRYIRHRGIGTRGSFVSLACLNRDTPILNDQDLLSRLYRGLYSGTVQCGHPNKGIRLVATYAQSKRYALAIGSGNVNVPGRTRSDIFRQFCQISGDQDGTANNAKLKLTVIGRVTHVRGTHVQLRDRVGINAAVAIIFRATRWESDVFALTHASKRTFFIMGGTPNPYFDTQATPDREESTPSYRTQAVISSRDTSD